MENRYEHLIVRRPMNVNELPAHDLSQVIPYPVLMCRELVPEANAWALYLFIKEITQELKDIAIRLDRAVPHKHDFDEMYLMIGDPQAITFEVILGDETYQVSTPSAVYIPKGTPHAIRPVDATVGLSGGLIPVCLNGEYVTLPVD
jgi:mannose-6-phosphate isomerase-like protein (cupin superfamily)